MTTSTFGRFLRFVLGPLMLALGLSLVTGTMNISGAIIGVATGDFQEPIVCQEFHSWPILPGEPGAGMGELGDGGGDGWASVTASVEGPDDNESLAIAVNGAYPSYGVSCAISYEVGLPDGAMVQLTSGLIFTPQQGLTDCEEEEIPGPAERWNCVELTVIYTPPVADQCLESGVFTDTLIFHVEQPALQSDLNAEPPVVSGMEFQVSLEWNECTDEIVDPEDPEDPGDPDDPGNPFTPGSFTNFDPPLTSEVSGARDEPRAVARVLPATGSGGLLDDAANASRIGLGSLLFLAGAALLIVGLPTGGFRGLAARLLPRRARATILPGEESPPQE